jgi:hypothetical protein
VTSCKRCPDCRGEKHHFIGPQAVVGETEPGFICEHCDYTTPAERCTTCGDLVPIDILTGSYGERKCSECRPKLRLVKS